MAYSSLTRRFNWRSYFFQLFDITIFSVLHLTAVHCPFFDSTVLYCSWLFQLHCTVWLHCTTLYCLTMNSTRLHASARSFPFVLYYCGVRSTTLHCTVIHWIVGTCAILHCNTAPFISVRWPAASSSSVTSELTSTCAYSYSAQRLQPTTQHSLVMLNRIEIVWGSIKAHHRAICICDTVS